MAIARVNRVHKDKPGGLIVDYIGIADEPKKALAVYSESDREETGIPLNEAVAILMEKYRTSHPSTPACILLGTSLGIPVIPLL